MIDFVVRGTPRSQQARSKKQWKNDVEDSVPPQFELLVGPLRLRIDFLFNGSTDLDTDNIIKPIQDALENILYDDEIVIDVCARKIDLQRLPSLVAAPSALLAALAEPPSDFVFIQVAAASRGLTFS